MTTRYSLQEYDPKNTVRVIGRHMPISRKTSVEVLNFIRGRNIVKAITLLEAVADAKTAIPFNRYNRDIPHRRGKRISVGRFPKKTSTHIADLLKLLQANANDKGLDSKALTIIHAAAQTGPRLWHYGRHRRRQRKVCHIELAAKEIKETKKKEVKMKKGGNQ